ncbi:MAG TPA: BTAD domain-containing putative transcriptional regulator [Gemmatimonadaceae bacterium]|nr:BTAD domain-containing putative transcriptional regulator [Gemmatimonadaceae bacterium]
MLRLKTLGGWNVTRADGSPRDLPAQRVALLALLCAAGERGISRDRAAALLWPDRADDNARHSLGQSLYALRRDADSADVVVGTATLALNPAIVQCDAWLFESAVRAGELERSVAMYDGRFLDGLHLRASAELQQMVDAEAARLAKAFGESVEALARRAANAGDALRAVEWWRRLAAEDPYSSRVARELVRALAYAGDRVAALKAAHVHETLVREEMDVDPDPAFMQYVAELRSDAVVTERHISPRGPVEPVPPFLPPTPLAAQPNGPRRRRKHWLPWAIGAVATGVVLAGSARFVRRDAGLDPRRVYVAPFENRTGDAALDPVGPMASDWVTHGLEQTGVVAVASPARAERFDEKERTPSMPAQELGAGTVISGAYYRVGDQLRVHVQVAGVAGNEVLDSFDALGGTAADPTAVLEMVRQRAMASLASLVDPRLSSWVRVASRPPTYQAYREFVTGQSYWGTDRRQALTHFLRAADLDSTFYAARVEAAILHRLLNECDRTEAIAAELAVVRGRLAPYDYHVLDGQLAQCHGDWERSYRDARAVADLRPGSAFLDYSVALQAMQLGRFTEARAILDSHSPEHGVAEVGENYALVHALVLGATGDRPRALALTRWLRSRYPTFSRAWATEGVQLARDGRAGEAERLFDTMTALPLVPASGVMQGLRRAAAALAVRGDTVAARRILMRALATTNGDATAAPNADRAQLLYELGRFDEARTLLTRLVTADSGNVDHLGYLAFVAARCGEESEARAIDARLAAMTRREPASTFTRSLYRARIAALSGNRDQAIALLATALDENSRFLLPTIRELGEFASLRDDERFKRLVTLR